MAGIPVFAKLRALSTSCVLVTPGLLTLRRVGVGKPLESSSGRVVPGSRRPRRPQASRHRAAEWGDSDITRSLTTPNAVACHEHKLSGQTATGVWKLCLDFGNDNTGRTLQLSETSTTAPANDDLTIK